MKNEKEASPSAWQVALGEVNIKRKNDGGFQALGEENIKRKNDGGFLECLGIWHSGKDILKKGRGLPRVPRHLALGEGYFFKKQRGLPRVPGHGHSGKRFKKRISSPGVAIGEEVSKKSGDDADGVKSSPRGSMTLGERLPRLHKIWNSWKASSP
jgi:hypothetical protein